MPLASVYLRYSSRSSFAKALATALCMMAMPKASALSPTAFWIASATVVAVTRFAALALEPVVARLVVCSCHASHASVLSSVIANTPLRIFSRIDCLCFCQNFAT